MDDGEMEFKEHVKKLQNKDLKMNDDSGTTFTESSEAESDLLFGNMFKHLKRIKWFNIKPQQFH